MPLLYAFIICLYYMPLLYAFKLYALYYICLYYMPLNYNAHQSLHTGIVLLQCNAHLAE